MPGKRHKKRNPTQNPAPNTRGEAMHGDNSPAANETSQMTETGNAASLSNEVTTRPDERPTRPNIHALDLYDASDSESRDQATEGAGVVVATVNPVATNAEAAEGVERAEGVGETSETRLAEAPEATLPTAKNPEAQAAQDRRSSRELDLALRPAVSQSGDDSTESEDISAEPGEESDAVATHDTKNVEASRATPDLAESNEEERESNNSEYEIDPPSPRKQRNYDAYETDSSSESDSAEDEIDPPSPREPDCPTQLRECREEKKDLERRLDEQITLVQKLEADLAAEREKLEDARQQRQDAEIEKDAAIYDCGMAMERTDRETKQIESERVQMNLERDELNKEIDELKKKLAECKQHRKIADELAERQKKLIRECAIDARRAGQDHVETLIRDLGDRNADVADLKAGLASSQTQDTDTDVMDEAEDEEGDVEPVLGDEDVEM